MAKLSKVKMVQTAPVVSMPEVEQGTDGTNFTLSAEEIAEIRAEYEEAHGKATVLNDEQIISMVESNDEDDERPWSEVMVDIETSIAEQTDDDGDDDTADVAVTNASMARVHTLAVEYAALLSADTVFTGLVQEKVENDAKEGVRPLNIMHRLIATLGKERMDAAPIVGTDKDTCGNRLPDQYSYPVNNADGTTTTLRGSFWRDAAYALPIAKAVFSRKDAIAKSVAEKKNLNKISNKALVEELDGQLESIVRAVRIGARVYYQMQRINEECGPVKAEHYVKTVRTDDGAIVKGADGKPMVEYAKGKAPIYICSTENTPEAKEHFDFISVGQLLAYKVDRCKANGGGYPALVNSSKKPSKKGQASAVPDASMDNLPAFVANMGVLVDDDDNITAIKRVCQKNHEFLLALADMHDNLDKVLGEFTAPRPKLGKGSLLAELRATRAAADMAEQQSKNKTEQATRKLARSA